MGVTTAHAPGLDQLLTRELSVGQDSEHRVRCKADTDAPIGQRIAGAAEDRVGTVPARQVLDVVAGCTVGIDALNVDGVTGSGRDVLDGQGQLTSKAPLVVGMARLLANGVVVVRGMVVMRGNRRLEKTPGLVNAHHRNQVRSGRSGNVIGAETTAKEVLLPA